MFFHVRELGLKPGTFHVELAPGEVDYLDEKIRQKSPLKAEGKVDLVSDSLEEIRFKGHLTVDMEADCDRCLDPAPYAVDAEFELFYRPITDGYGEEVKLEDLKQDEVEMGFYEGDGMELNDVLREFVLLSLPMQRLCSEGCNGICPVCGQNRNQQKCECVTAAVDDRWAVLKDLQKN
ncbi:MAG: DUF177 domain-containing protein [Bryobacteraceae bacterium]